MTEYDIYTMLLEEGEKVTIKSTNSNKLSLHLPIKDAQGNWRRSCWSINLEEEQKAVLAGYYQGYIEEEQAQNVRVFEVWNKKLAYYSWILPW